MRYAKCHPDRKNDSRGLCHACAQRKNYRAKRKAGLPYWVASCRTPQGWLGHTAAVDVWRQAHRETYLGWQKKVREKQIRLYGGNPSKNMAARIRWLMAKAKKRPRNRRKAIDGVVRKLPRAHAYYGDSLVLRKMRAPKKKGRGR